jgi:hypothetical protein
MKKLITLLMAVLIMLTSCGKSAGLSNGGKSLEAIKEVYPSDDVCLCYCQDNWSCIPDNFWLKHLFLIAVVTVVASFFCGMLFHKMFF